MEELVPQSEPQLEKYLAPGKDIFSEQQTANLSDYIRIFIRRKWSIFLIFSSVIIIALVYNFTATKYYRARSTIMIRPQVSSDILKTKQIVFPNYYEKRSGFETKVNIITTLPILTRAGKILVEKGYFRPPNFEQLNEEQKELLYKKVGKALRGKVSSKNIEKTRLVDIFVIDTDPKRVAAIANAVAEAMVEYNSLEQEMISYNSLKFLNQQLENARKRLSEAENKLYQYKQKNKIFETRVDKSQLAGQKMGLESRIRDLDTQIKILNTKIEGLRSLLTRKDYNKYTPFQTEDELLRSLNQELVSAEIEYELLTQRYKQEHPLVKQARERIDILKKKFEEELNKNIHALEMRKKLFLAERQKLEKDLEDVNKKAMEIISKDAEYIVLEREANSARELFNNLLSAVKEANIQAQGSFEDMIYIYEYAEPSFRPIKPKKILNLIIASLLGIFLGISWAIMAEMMDRTIRVPEDVEFHNRIPILSLLPSLEENLVKGKYPLVVLEKPRSLYSEGILHLRANLRLIIARQGLKTLILTSSGPREGKSIVSANLSASIAQEGIRTLLIDADLRRPVQHRYFKIDKDQGITWAIIELLQNQKWKESIEEYTFGDLHLLLKLQKQNGLLSLNFNSSYPLHLLYQNGRIVAGNIKEWRETFKASLDDLTPEEIKIEWQESTSEYKLLPSIKPEEVEEFFSQFPGLTFPSVLSYRLFNDFTHSIESVEGLRVMPSGPIPSNPAEILGSVYFRSLVDLLKPHFDLIIFDTAPCWPLSDVSLLSQVADGLILLVRAHRSNWDALNKNMQMLRMLNFKVLGAIFNDFDVKRERYYYGKYYHYHYYYYYYYYQYGYYSSEEAEKSS